MPTDIGVWLQLIMLLLSLGGVGVASFFAYQKGRKDEKYKQIKNDNEQLQELEKERTAAKPDTRTVRDSMRDGEF